METRSGAVSGLSLGRMLAWRGIPYARPPVGPLRWLPPQPAVPWTGLHEATRFPARAMQALRDLPGRAPRETDAVSEDCLYVNVCSPETRGRRPVLVWVHGGGFVDGSGAHLVGDGSRFAEEGDVVFVSFNYRLGTFGFLPLPSAWNCGLLDQIAALRWVQANIEAFGGDPGRVTLTGVSAGAKSIGTLLATPAARGLFWRAILHSGGAETVYDTAGAAELARELLTELGVEESGGLRSLPAETLLAAQEHLASGAATFWTWRPVVDGKTIPRRPLEAVTRGTGKGIALLLGTTRHEARLFAAIDPAAPALVPAVFRRSLGGRAENLLAAYEGRYVEAMTAERYWIPTIRLAERHGRHAPVWMYRFDWEDPALGDLGAAHGTDVQLLVNGDGLGAVMRSVWLAFAYGEPPDWPHYEQTRRATMIFDREPYVADDPEKETRLLWEGLDCQYPRWVSDGSFEES